MAGIKQTVPNYIFGASNQPDQLKIPGFVNEAINIYPDVTEGCEKRHGTRHINTLTGVGTTELTWFAMDHGNDEIFIGKVDANGNVRIWECETGIERTVRETGDSSTYLTHSAAEDIQVITINDYTYIVNRSINTAMDYTGATTSPEQGNKAFVDLSAIAYGKQYSLDISYENVSNVPKVTTRATKLSIEWVPGGDRRDDEDNDSGPNVDSEESCMFNTREIRTINAVGSGRPVNEILMPDKHSLPEPTEGAVQNQGDIINLPGKNLRFEVSMIGTPFIAGYHGSKNNAPYYWAHYDINIDLLHGGEHWRKGDTFYIQIGEPEPLGNAGTRTIHKVTVEEHEEIETKADWLIRPEPTTHDGSQVLTADKILDSLKKEILRHQGDFTIEKIGSGLLLENSVPFKVDTTESNLFSIIGNDVHTVAGLPTQCQGGYVVKVSNSSLDEDDYYLNFTTDLSGVSGAGTWVETVAPESKNHILPETMPHQIVKNTDGTFDVKPMVWEDRLAGDNTTNPKPTFLKGFGSGLGIGSPISNILFWRNRLVLLSKNNICLTQPLKSGILSPGEGGQIYDVWGKSAIALSPGDAIDVTATSNQVCNLWHGIEVNAGLMLFSEYEQFLLTTDSDVVTPETVKVKRVSSWSYSQRCSPISLGNSIAFCDNAGRHSRLFEMSNITRETEPLVTELSKPITESIPTGIKSIAESRENGLVVLAHHSPYSALNPDPIGDADHCNSPYDYVYGYKYFTSGSKRIQSAWFKWKFPGRVLWHTIIRDTYYLILDNDLPNVRLLAMDLIRKESSTVYSHVGSHCDLHRTYLDEMHNVTATGVYDGTYTRYPIPESLYTGSQVTPGDLWVIYTGQYQGSRHNVFWSGGEAYIQGDHTSGQTIMGFAYDMKLKLPVIYPTKKTGDAYIADTTSTLTVHRCKLNMGISGAFSVYVYSKDRDAYSTNFEASSQHTHDNNINNIRHSQTVDVPIYQLNTNFKLEFNSNNPTPCTLNSMTWEGDYNTLYKSV